MNTESPAENTAAHETEYHTDIPVGEILRRTRTHHGLSLEDVEGALRIRSVLLDSLEQGDVSKLPGRAYAIGFVRSYSEYLGLEGDLMVDLFKRQSVGQQGRPTLVLPVPASESKMPSPLIISSAAGGLLLIIVIAVIFMLVPSSQEVPDVPEDLKISESELENEMAGALSGTLVANDDTSSALSEVKDTMSVTSVDVSEAVAAETTQKPVSGTMPAEQAMPEHDSRIVVRAIENSWVEIRDNSGNVLVSRVLEKGNFYLLPDDPSLVMDTGSVGALEIVLDGEKLPSLGKVGEIARSISLDPQKLRAKADGLR